MRKFFYMWRRSRHKITEPAIWKINQNMNLRWKNLPSSKLARVPTLGNSKGHKSIIDRSVLCLLMGCSQQVLHYNPVKQKSQPAVMNRRRSKAYSSHWFSIGSRPVIDPVIDFGCTRGPNISPTKIDADIKKPTSICACSTWKYEPVCVLFEVCLNCAAHARHLKFSGAP